MSTALCAPHSFSPRSSFCRRSRNGRQSLPSANRWNRPPRISAYNALQVAFATFREAHLRHESCLSAAPCQLSQNAEQTVLDRSFLSLTVAGRPFPSIPDDSVASADANLNLTYQRLFDSLPDACQPTSATCLSQSAFRDVERDWIRYRDAWVTFGVLHWPESTENYWKSPLTLARIEQLKAMYAARH
jgi:uncharacterized protein YecT (DUF1311 family)